MRSRRLWTLALCSGLVVAGMVGQRAQGAAPPVVAYDKALGDGWLNFGWANKAMVNGEPVQVDVGDFGGWIVAKPGGLDPTFGALELVFVADNAFAGSLALALADDRKSTFPELNVPVVKPDASGQRRVSFAFAKLDPAGLRFDRIIIRGRVALPKNSILRVVRLALTPGSGPTQVPTRAGAPLKATATRAIAASIDCKSGPKPISPLIYGIANNLASDTSNSQQWTMGATARRWGGNPTTRYNWKSKSWNTAFDYFYQNVAIPGHEQFLADNEAHHLTSVLTVPIIGWVAKDAVSYSFSVKGDGAQQGVDPNHPDIGNGIDKNGKKIRPGSPEQTSTAAPPAYIAEWIATLKDRVDQYQLDNEPEIWDTTHRDVHPEPVSYDELWQRTRDYAAAIRKVDPTSVISGPASWGWLGYNYSGVDAAAGFTSKPDRSRHGDLPLLAWYLQQLQGYEKQTGVRLVDALDVHYYPQEENIYGQSGRIDPDGAALRIRSTRSLWDPTYTDESWIKEKISLLPRLSEWIKNYYPGTKMSIGEWNFGGETHMSGALATAESLGRFGQFGLYAAYYWTVPPADSPTYWAFRAFRDVDGKGLRFGDTSVATTVADPSSASLFGSIDSRGKVVAIALNLSPSAVLNMSVGTTGCPAATKLRHLTYDGTKSGFVPEPGSGATAKSVTLRPWTINVLEWS